MNVEKYVSVFNSTNYTKWSSEMTDFLKATGLWFYVNGDVTKPTAKTASTSTTDEATIRWMENDMKAVGNIRI